MYRALTAQQSREIEQRAVSQAGVSLQELMQRAGAAVAEQVQRDVPAGDVVVACGPGNNGGDGWVAARELHAAGRTVRVLSMRDFGKLEGIAADAAREAVGSGVTWRVPDGPPGVDAFDAAVVVDALLGTRATVPLRGDVAAWCSAINDCGAYVISVDVPTGVDSDTGGCALEAIKADCTVTFTAPKRGLVLYPGAACAGEIVVARIGIPSGYLADVAAPEVWTAPEFAQLLPRPAPDAHKNQRGRVLVVAGSRAYPGAAVLAARGAMRMGAGFVTLAVPEPVVPVAQSHLLAAVVVGLPTTGRAMSSAAAAAVRDMAGEHDAVVLGPGLTVADGAAATARRLVSAIELPMVLDADGLNAFVDHVGVIEARTAPIVLTPHPGELARLLGVTTADVQADRLSFSARLAGPNRSVVLKGAGTVVSVEGRQAINTSGSVALATAGTGDVLAGMVGALLAQGLSPFDAGLLGAYVHGRAGEAAASALTPLSVIAEDVPEYIPDALGELLESW